MSSEVFERREDDFRNQFDGLTRKIVKQLPYASGESRKKIVRDIENDVEECNLLIQEMEGEARRAPPTFRLDMVAKVRTYRRDVDQMAAKVNKGPANSFSAPRGGTGGFFEEDDFDSHEDSQRSHLLQGSGALSRTSESLARTQRVAAETDQIGTEIIDELGQQRESLVRTQQRLHGTDANLSKSRKILNTMGKRIITNKVTLVVVILLELGILGGVVYWKFFS